MKQGQRGRGGRGGKVASEQTHQRVERDKQKDLRLTGIVRSVVSGDTLLIMDYNGEKAKANSQPNIFYLTLMGLKAPALGKKQVKDGQVLSVKDEPFAYDSREFLRKQLIGKLIIYRIEHQLESRPGEQFKRAFGDAWQTDGTNIRFQVLEAGWAKANPKERKPKEEGKELKPRQDDEDILAAQGRAQEKKNGIWSDDQKKAVRNVRYRDNATPEEQYAFFVKLKGKPQVGVVEQVRGGATLRVYLPDTQDEITVSLSGVRCPVFKQNDLAATETFGLEAKMYTEAKLLNRTISVILDGLDKFNFFATVLYGDKKQNVALSLLELGLATFVEWSASDKSAIAPLKEAEGKAKAAKLRLFKDFSAAPKADSNKPATTQKSLTGQVVEVVNPGSIIVRITKGNKADDYKLHFSSIKVPPMPNKKKVKQLPAGAPKEEAKKPEEAKTEKPQGVVGGPAVKGQAKEKAEKVEKVDQEAEAKKKQAEEDFQNAWALDARDWLRKTLIGKTVSCVWDYPVRVERTKEWKQYHSIYLGNQNVGLKLVEQGYAWSQKHAEDDPRSPEWKDMVLAERHAQANGLKLHGLKTAAPLHRLRINDLTSNEYYPKAGKKEKTEGETKAPKADPSRNRPFADELRKSKMIPAVVDYVISASRFRLLLPKQQYILTLSLSALRSDTKEKVTDDKSANADQNMQKSFPISAKDGSPIYPNIAFHFSRNALFQRDVHVDVEGVDAGGAFVGRIYIQVGNEMVDWGLRLLHEGHAALSDFASKIISDQKLLAAYQSAQNAAQDAHKNKWVNYDRAAVEAKKKQEAEERKKKKDFEQEGPAAHEQVNVTVTEIMSGSTFYYQLASANTENALSELESAFASGDCETQPHYTPKEIDPKNKEAKKERVAGKFTVDGNWYRAEVLRVIKPKEADGVDLYELRYIDYGNSEVVPVANIRQLPEALAKVNGGNPLSQRARLAYINAPDLDDDYGRDAAAFFKELVWGRPMRANIHKDRFSEEGVKQLTLGDEDGTHINGLLVKEGLARVDKYGPRSKQGSGKKTEYEILREFQEEAKKSRYNMWQYGELPDSDDERAFANQLR